MQPVLASLEPSPFEGDGGQLRRTVAATLAVSAANVAEIASELQRQIDEALRRAQVCERYTAAVRRYRRSTDPDRSFPVRPAPWADHG